MSRRAKAEEPTPNPSQEGNGRAAAGRANRKRPLPSLEGPGGGFRSPTYRLLWSGFGNSVATLKACVPSARLCLRPTRVRPPRGDTGAQGVPGEVTQAALDAAVADTARNPSGIAPFGGSFSDPPTQAEMQDFAAWSETLRAALFR